MPWFSKQALVAMMPSSPTLKGVADTGLDDFLRRFLSEAPALLRVGLYASALLYHITPLITVFVPLPAFLLPEKLRERHTRKLCAHPVYPVRMSTFTLKMVAGLCWGNDPEIRKRLNVRLNGGDPGTFQEGEAS